MSISCSKGLGDDELRIQWRDLQTYRLLQAPKAGSRESVSVQNALYDKSELLSQVDALYRR